MHNNKLITRDVVLVGGGHSHALVLRRFAMRPEPGVRLTLVSNVVDTPYSGMLPGYLAGHYGFDDVHIDLPRLARFAGARFVHAEAQGLDLAARRLQLRDRPPLRYDLLSINLGSTPRTDDVPGASDCGVPVKPIAGFNARWLALLERFHAHRGALHVVVVGAGAGGVELLLAMQHRLRAESRAHGVAPDALRFTLIGAETQLLPTHNPRVRQRFAQVLAERGVAVRLGARVVRAEPGLLHLQDGQALGCDEVVWVTRARGAPWLASTGLALDEDGCVRVDATLRAIGHSHVFAAGDVAAVQGQPREKAGVFAVRMGKPLAHNLRATLRGEPLRAYRPQARWLALISTGDRHAVASRGVLGFWGDWVWRWKDRIDRDFMRRFHDLSAMTDARPSQADAPSRLALAPQEAQQALSALAMRCSGCGAKVGPDVLSRALAGLEVVARDDVLIGLAAPDDAAVLRVPPGQVVVQSVDFFRAFVDDPYRFGAIAAQHALGDLYAMGARPQSALAIATVPPGLDAQVEALLQQMMAGAVRVLNAAGCALVGGHTGEGQELALGFAVQGLADDSPEALLRKDGLREGDVLILTKAVGSGVLLAAHDRLLAKGRWLEAALQQMEQGNAPAARCLQAHGARACTDITGFGLLGHLLEMTRASGVDAQLRLSAVPWLEGAREMAAAGVASSLAGANRRLSAALRGAQALEGDARVALLFDPQTAGGLLAGVPQAQAEACLAALRAAGCAHAAIVGVVMPADPLGAPIELLP